MCHPHGIPVAHTTKHFNAVTRRIDGTHTSEQGDSFCAAASNNDDPPPHACWTCARRCSSSCQTYATLEAFTCCTSRPATQRPGSICSGLIVGRSSSMHSHNQVNPNAHNHQLRCTASVRSHGQLAGMPAFPRWSSHLPLVFTSKAPLLQSLVIRTSEQLAPSRPAAAAGQFRVNRRRRLLQLQPHGDP
jgi:hypothetical protein